MYERKSAANSPAFRQPEAGKRTVVLDLADLGSSCGRNLEAAQRILDDVVSTTQGGTLEIELRTRIVGASFLGLLAQANASVRSKGARLRLLRISPRVREVLAVCGLEGLAW